MPERKALGQNDGERNFYTGGFVRTGYKFQRKVEKYIKGYQGRREDVYKPIVTDYKLSRSTKVKN
jgi:DNA-binding winged helix-turn-helix (wHTH) protein